MNPFILNKKIIYKIFPHFLVVTKEDVIILRYEHNNRLVDHVKLEWRKDTTW